MRRIGIFPGVFDPVHAGHIAFAQAAKKAANLDIVYFIPEANPWRKINVTSLQHRLAMLRILTAESAGLQPLRFRDDRFTVQGMLREVQQHFADAELFLLVGSDVAHESLPTWHDVDQLLDAMSLIIGIRSDEMQHRQQLATTYDSAVFIDTDMSHVCSTSIRQSTHPHTLVAQYVTAHKLYA